MADPRSTRQAALADTQAAIGKNKISKAVALAQLFGELATANLERDTAARKARAKVTAADVATQIAQKKAEAAHNEEPPPDITQFFPPTQINAANPTAGMGGAGGIVPPTMLENAGAGGARGGAIANQAVAGARQAAGTLPSAPPQQSGAGGSPGMSINVGGQQFSAPSTLTTTEQTTRPLQFDAGYFTPATTTRVVTQPNALSAADLLAAQQRNVEIHNATLFNLAKEGLIGPDAVTASDALNKGDYETFGRVLADKPLLSVQVQRQRMQVQDAQIDAYRAQTAESFERTRGSRILNDLLKRQIGNTAAGNGELSDNDIFGIPYAGAQGGGFPTSVHAALGMTGQRGGDLTPNQVGDKLRLIKPEKDGTMGPVAQSELLHLQGWGIAHGIAVFSSPKRGPVTDLMRSFGFAQGEFSNVRQVPMAEVLGTALAAERGDKTSISRLRDEWGLFEDDGHGGLNPLTSGPNMALSAGIVRKLQLIADANGYGADVPMPQADVPAAETMPTPSPAATTPRTPEQQAADKALMGAFESARTHKEALKAKVKAALSQPAPVIPTESPEEAAFKKRLRGGAAAAR